MYENGQFISGLLKELRIKGYDCKREEDEIEIRKNGVPIMLLRTNGNTRIHDGAVNECTDEIRSLYQIMKEAYDLYFNSPILEFEGLERYHKLADFKDCVLAARLQSDNSLEFVTWQKVHDKTSLTWGNYFTGYEAAKEDFAIRTGLVDRYRMFNETELKLIHQGLVHLGADYPHLTAEQMTNVGKTIEKVEMIVPEICKHEELEHCELVPDDELSL